MPTASPMPRRHRAPGWSSRASAGIESAPIPDERPAADMERGMTSGFRLSPKAVVRGGSRPRPWARGSGAAAVPTCSHRTVHRGITNHVHQAFCARSARLRDLGAGLRLRCRPCPGGAVGRCPDVLSGPRGTELLPPGAGVSCSSGNFCASVWDPTANRFRVFHFYNCTRYYLSNWNDWGEAKNSQTGGAVATIYGSGGDVIRTFPADNNVYAADWTPVHSIRNC